jgi:streptomycin 6-kinase
MTDDIFAPWLARWRLTRDGEAIATHSSRLLPVIAAGAPAMLKIATHAEEQRGGMLMVWWGAAGAARVLRRQGQAILLERLTGARSLAAMARGGEDDAATRILCAAAAALHAPRPTPPPKSLVPLPIWFRALAPAAARHGGVLLEADACARALLASPRDAVVLHGDIHHDNVLDGGPRGWQAIDPKGLIGERGFDYANTVCNPDFACVSEPGRMRRRLEVIAGASGQDPVRLHQWLLAYLGLSAAWTMDEGAPGKAADTLVLARLAAAELAAHAGPGRR